MSTRYRYGQGNGQGRAKRIKELRRLRQQLSVTDERDMGIRAAHAEIFGLECTDFRQAAREWFLRCPF